MSNKSTILLLNDIFRAIPLAACGVPPRNHLRTVHVEATLAFHHRVVFSSDIVVIFSVLGLELAPVQLEGEIVAFQVGVVVGTVMLPAN